MFSGIGGFELGILQAAGDLPMECVGYSEIDPECTRCQEAGRDKYQPQTLIGKTRSRCNTCGKEKDQHSLKVYERNFAHDNYGDATGIDTRRLPDFELLVGGFPCQAFSIAGKRGGFDDTRGTLFFDIARILKAKKPSLCVLENVKGLISHDRGRTFDTIIRALDELGYDCQWSVLNSKNFGVPQSRERIYIIGHLRGTRRPQVFPLTSEDQAIIGQHQNFVDLKLEGAVTTKQSRTIQARYYKGYSNRYGENSGVMIAAPSPKYGDGKRNIKHTLQPISPTIRATQAKAGDNQPKVVIPVLSGTLRTHKDGEGFRAVRSGLAPTIPARPREDGSGQPIVAIPVIDPTRPNKTRNGGRMKGNNDPSYTLTGQDQHGVYDGASIRRLTPKECERLQGFPDDWTKIGVGGGAISDTQRYKMCGNAVTVNVVEAVMLKLLFSEEEVKI